MQPPRVRTTAKEFKELNGAGCPEGSESCKANPHQYRSAAGGAGRGWAGRGGAGGAIKCKVDLVDMDLSIMQEPGTRQRGPAGSARLSEAPQSSGRKRNSRGPPGRGGS